MNISKITDTGNRNQEILHSMVKDYSKFNEVEAIALGGSSAVKSADSHSDYDVYIYCHKEPAVSERRKIAEKYADKPEIDNHFFETGDVFTLRETGKPIDIMYRSTEGIEANIKWVWQEGNASLGYTTCFVDNVNKSQILFDRNNWFKNLQAKTNTPYPKKLSNNIIKKNFAYLKDVMFSYYDQIESAVKRSDYVSINHRTAAFLASYFDIIFAKNKVLNPGEKRLVDFAKTNCKILPENFEKDVNTLAAGAVSKKLKTAAGMVKNLRKIL